MPASKETHNQWAKWWFSDFTRDTQHLSAEACGIWSRVLAALHFATPRGEMTLPAARWAKIGIVTQAKMMSSIDELRDPVNPSGAPVADILISGDSITIHSRRMIRERIESEAGRKHGLKGGNPALKGGGSRNGRGGGLTPPLKPEREREEEIEEEGEATSQTPGVEHKGDEAIRRLVNGNELLAAMNMGPTQWAAGRKMFDLQGERRMRDLVEMAIEKQAGEPWTFAVGIMQNQAQQRARHEKPPVAPGRVDS